MTLDQKVSFVMIFAALAVPLLIAVREFLRESLQKNDRSGQQWLYHDRK